MYNDLRYNDLIYNYHFIHFTCMHDRETEKQNNTRCKTHAGRDGRRKRKKERE